MFGRSRLRMISLLLALVVLAPSLPTFAASDRLPDLGMAQLRDVHIEKSGGRRLLRFTAVIVNVGAGPFAVLGQRPDISTAEMTTQQRIYDDAGGSRYVSTPAVMKYSGVDGHNHWHLQYLEGYELDRLDNGSKVGTSAKHDFCFSDNESYRLTLPGAPQAPVYTNCGRSDWLQVTMGLSIGWGDRYHYTLPDQYIDITGLGAGRYRLWATADPSNWFQETNDNNNFTWVDIQVKAHGATLTVLGYGPTP
jgi:hypothetical protein